MLKEILTDGKEIDYIEVASSNITNETTVSERTTANLVNDLGNSHVCEEGTKVFCRDTLKWYSSNGDGTVLYLFSME